MEKNFFECENYLNKLMDEYGLPVPEKKDVFRLYLGENIWSGKTDTGVNGIERMRDDKRIFFICGSERIPMSLMPMDIIREFCKISEAAVNARLSKDVNPFGLDFEEAEGIADPYEADDYERECEWFECEDYEE